MVARGGGATRVGEAPNAGSWAAGPCAPGPGPGAGTAGMHRRYRYGGRAGETAQRRRPRDGDELRHAD